MITYDYLDSNFVETWKPGAREFSDPKFSNEIDVANSDHFSRSVRHFVSLCAFNVNGGKEFYKSKLYKFEIVIIRVLLIVFETNITSTVQTIIGRSE